MKARIEYEDQIIFVYPAAFTDEQEAEEFVIELDKYLMKTTNPRKIIVDIKEYQGSSTKARYILGHFLKERKEDVHKVAFVSRKGNNLDIAIKIVMAIGGFGKFKIMDNMQAALKWVKED